MVCILPVECHVKPNTGCTGKMGLLSTGLKFFMVFALKKN